MFEFIKNKLNGMVDKKIPPKKKKLFGKCTQYKTLIQQMKKE